MHKHECPVNEEFWITGRVIRNDASDDFPQFLMEKDSQYKEITESYGKSVNTTESLRDG